MIPFAAAALLALSSIATEVALGAPPDKLACADITNGGGHTTANGSAWDFEFGMETAVPCGGVVFTMYVFANEADCNPTPEPAVEPLATIVVHGAKTAPDGLHGEVVFAAKALPDNDGRVWVYATSTYRKSQVDYAPDPEGSDPNLCTDYDPSGGFAKPFG